MRHLLEVYDIESDIEGEKFIPKKLDLMRLNMNDLTRHDAVMTKRVRVRQVDIGGVLQVAVGNSTLDEMADENRELRQELADLREKQATMRRELQQDLQNNSKKYDDLINRLNHSASPNPSATCSSHPMPLKGFWCDVRCPDGKFLTQFHAVSSPPGAKMYCEITCCSVI